MSESLSQAVEAIKENERAKRRSEKVEQKVKLIQTHLTSLNEDIEALAEAVEELQFYREILYEAFDVSVTGGASITQAQDAVQWDQQELVQRLIDADISIETSEDEKIDEEDGSLSPEFEEYRQQIKEAQRSVEKEREIVRQQLTSKQQTWTDRLDSASDLQQIIGSPNDEFANTISWLRRLVTQDMFNPEKSASAVVAEWERALDQWNGREGLHGKEAFQQEHGLSDETMEAIEQLSRKSSLQLENIDIEVIEEMQSVPELAKTVELSI